jgi:hypothetical protein
MTTASAISGSGYGDSHHWEKPSHLQILIDFDGSKISPVGGPTVYRCNSCGVMFRHFYHKTPAIFDAMRDSGVVDVCPGLSQ